MMTSSAKPLEDIRALQVKLDTANKKIQQCNDTIVSQANELTIMRNIICQSCRRKLLDAMFASWAPSSAPLSSIVAGVSASLMDSPSPDSAFSTPQVAASTAERTMPIHAHSTRNVPDSQSIAHPISTNSSSQPMQEGTSISYNLPEHPQQVSISRISSNDTVCSSNATPTFGSSSTSAPPIDLSVDSPSSPFDSICPDTARPVSAVRGHSIADLLALFEATAPPPVSIEPSSLPLSTLSKQEAAPLPVIPPGEFGKTDAISTSHTNTRPSNPELASELPWSVVHGRRDKVLDVTFERAFAHHDAKVYCVKFSLDGKYIAVGLTGRESGYFDGKVVVYSTETGKQACLLTERTEEKKSGVRSMCFSPDGRELAIGHSDGHIRLWLIASKRVRSVFRSRQEGITDLDFSPNGRSIVSASASTTARIWSVRDGSSKVLSGRRVEIWTNSGVAKFSPDGRHVAGADGEGFLMVWDSRTCQLVAKWHGHKNVVSGLAFMPDGKGLVTGSSDCSVKYWQVAALESASVTRNTVTLFHQFEVHSGWVSSFAIAGDGQWVLNGIFDRSGTAHLWNANGTQECTLHGHLNSIWSVALSNFGDSLAIGDSKGQVSLWKYKKLMRNQGRATCVT